MMRSRPAFALLVSMILVVPCLWLPIVSSGDLQSHLYNAWLAKLIHQGQAPGLSIERQTTNVLADIGLAFVFDRWGAAVAERTVCCAAILIFFWGAYRFVATLRGDASRPLMPLLGVLSYGFVFQAGFLNYYLSAGFVLWALAVAWQGNTGRLLWIAPLLILAYFAHPLPVVWFFSLVLYRAVADRLRPRWQAWLFSLGVALLFLVRRLAMARYEYVWRPHQILMTTGLDQLLLYGRHYLWAALVVLILIAALLFRQVRQEGKRVLASVPAQLYGLTAAAIFLLPMSLVTSPQSAGAGLIPQRLSLFSGVLLLSTPRCLSGGQKRWTLAAGLLAALLFFALLYSDLAKAARLEARMESLVATLSPGERVIAYIPDGEAGAQQGRVSLVHLLARVCIERCFDFMNYEPSSRHFRIRAAPGNAFVEASIERVSAMEVGLDVRRPDDPPMHVVYRCGRDLCLRALPVGQSSQDLAGSTEN